MDLILWRHAEALSGDNDLERVLSARGEKQARSTAAWLNQRLPENCRILVSPARRAQQTAAALGHAYTTIQALLPNAQVSDVLSVSGWPDASGVVLIVGHQPALGEVAMFLLDDDFDGLSWTPSCASLCWMRKEEQGASLVTIFTPE
ncbi:MAG: histidine phosphatase family protein [Burkholderiales bacterium]|jgi:phosphohistidine phosphatase|nr:histidine phosphatase family protein [Burkholderiales bacterium]